MHKSKHNKLQENELELLLKNFNWKCYLDNNKDLVGLIETKRQAIYHFKKYGYKEGRKCVPQVYHNIKNTSITGDNNNSVLNGPIASSYIENIKLNCEKKNCNK
jgi:hypothetical protein